MPAEDRPARYRFAPPHRPGLVAGFRGGQLVAVGAGLLLGVGVLRALPDAAGAALAAAVVAGAVGVAAWPVGGRTVEEWAPDAARFGAGMLHRPRLDAGAFRSLQLLAVDVEGAAPVGVVVDRRRGVYSAVVPVQAPGFVLLGPVDKDRRVAAWSGVLASLARDAGGLHRLQWVERTVPDDGGGPRADLDRRGRLPAGAPAERAYRQLLDQAAAGAVRHAVLLVASVRGGRRPTLTGGPAADEPACLDLLRQLALLRRRLVDAEVASSPPLGPGALASAVAAASAPGPVVAAGPVVPGAGDRLAGIAGAGRRTVTGTGVWPWPMATAEEWGRLRTDGTWHVTWWVAQWPRTDVPADFLASLLLAGDVRRTVSVVMAPVGPAEAARQVERDRTAEAADRELRRRGGFLDGARRQRQAAGLACREAELADGHGAFRFCAYVSVTVDDVAELDTACQQVEQAAAQSGLELRRCYGDQARAFVATLPVGAGLP